MTITTDYLIETIEYAGHKIKIYHDSDAGDRYDDHPNSYGNGDWENGPSAECPDSKPWQWLSVWRLGNDDLAAGFLTPNEFIRYFQDTHEISIVRQYTHGGTAFSISNSGQFACNFDSGFAGLVAIAKDHPVKGASPRQVAEDTVKHFQSWWNKDYCGYEVEGPFCDDSCWGFLIVDHDRSYMIKEAKANIEASLRCARKAHFENLKKKIKGKCPLHKRPKFPI